MFDSSLITYAVSLHFTPDVNEIITSAVKSIAEVTGNSFIIENKIPPHVTIGAFHAAKEDEPKLIQMVEEFAKSQKSGIIQFKEIGNFNSKVLFLKPEIWFPHTTLATRLNQRQFEKTSKIAESIKLPLEAEINEVAVYQCSPFAELKHLSLNS